MLGTPRAREHVDDFWNYAYRGGMAFVAAARAFGSDEHDKMMLSNMSEFQEATGREY